MPGWKKKPCLSAIAGTPTRFRTRSDRRPVPRVSLDVISCAWITPGNGAARRPVFSLRRGGNDDECVHDVRRTTRDRVPAWIHVPRSSRLRVLPVRESEDFWKKENLGRENRVKWKATSRARSVINTGRGRYVKESWLVRRSFAFWVYPRVIL